SDQRGRAGARDSGSDGYAREGAPVGCATERDLRFAQEIATEAASLPTPHGVPGSRRNGTRDGATLSDTRDRLRADHQRRGRIASGRKLASVLPTSLLISSLSNAFMRSMRSLCFSGSTARLSFSSGSAFRSKSWISLLRRICSRVVGVLKFAGA